jgi:hypothetical protein
MMAKIIANLFSWIMFSCSYRVLAHSDSSNSYSIKTPREGIFTSIGIIASILYTNKYGVTPTDVFISVLCMKSVRKHHMPYFVCDANLAIT